MKQAPCRGLLSSALVLLACAGPVAAQAPKDEDIANAIRKGVGYLKTQQQMDGGWHYGPLPEHHLGATALAGWTLLECGVPPTDPVIQKAAAFFRSRCARMDRTYTMTLGIFFLDRLGDEADIPIIEALSLRLILGMNRYGGWGYQTLDIHPADLAFLENHIKTMKPGKINPKAPKDRADRKEKQISRDVWERMTAYRKGPGPADNKFYGDHSNTQFGMMGLWVARRYGFPTERLLMRTEFRFRKCQYPTGGWGYEFAHSKFDPKIPETGPSLALTCAGLLGIALGHACDTERVKQDLGKDPQVIEALSVVAATIGNPVGDPANVPSLKGKGRIYYALWSLERMAVVYGLEGAKIGPKDWYGWGAELLIVNQNTNGSWMGDYGEAGCDTCFALLFLKRANVAVDLTEKVKVKPEIKDVARIPLPDLPNIVGKDDGVKTPPKKEKEKESPPKKTDVDARVLGEQLVAAAAPAKQDEVLKQFKEARGPLYDEALASAIPKLKKEDRARPRAVLAERLAQSPAGLKAYLKSENVELRHAAAEAAGHSKNKALLPELINLLEDNEAFVGRAAQQALFNLARQNFGPGDDATRADWADAAKAWRDWLKKQPK
jgi:hypothetical protein